MLTMPTDCIAFRDTNYFSSLICDYLDEKPELQPFYNRFPTIDNFEAQIEEKKLSVRAESRTILVKSLQKQYRNVNTSEATLSNIEALSKENSYTITTGHQLNLFTGPLYFLYKIISAINLSRELKSKYPKNEFVPVYWMATEDHDFEEINYFNFDGKKVKWDRHSSGAVGELDLVGLDEVFNAFSNVIGNSSNANELKGLFKSAYLEHNNLADATRYLANELFKDYGLVIINANDKDLKRLFVPFAEEELVKQTSYNVVSKTNVLLNEVSDKYKIQVNPREINLFYITEGLRERIVEVDGIYKVLNSEIIWSLSEIKKLLSEYPERFSPNVILRPLYQEVILPNLCYIGGGGELAYWFQLKTNFEAVNVPFPILLLRNSVLIKTEKQSEKLTKLNVSDEELFMKQEDLIVEKVKELSEIKIDFIEQKEHLKKQFEDLHKLAKQTDKSFLGAVGAQERKQIKGLEHLEKRLLKAQKRKLKDHTNRITELQDQLFPGKSLQERNLNFSEVYLEYGTELVPKLISELEPLKLQFSILEL